MPKPLFLSRPSGLYVRFRVPSDLRDQVGSRFLIRSLRGYVGDDARLVAAFLGVSLSRSFDALRRCQGMVDVKKRLEEAKRKAKRLEPDGEEVGIGDDPLRPWSAKHFKVGHLEFQDLQVDGPADNEAFLKMARELGAGPVGASGGAATAPAVPDDSPMLAAEIEHHLADMERRKLAPDTITESRHTLRIFLATTGDIPVREIKASHVRAFLDAVRWFPSNATVVKKYRNLSVLKMIEAGKRDKVPAPSVHTLNKHNQKLGSFFNGLVNQDLMNKNPLRGIKPDVDTSTEPETGRAFTPKELSAIFEPARYKAWATGYSHRWWAPMLGLYTGARVNEIAQLYVDDVKQIEGVWGLFFWKNARGQKIKNKSSIRFVPLAQPVIEAGFLSFVDDMRAAKEPRLFPQLPAGKRADGTLNGKGFGVQLSKQFGAYVKTLGVEKGTGFHAFRHTLSTALAELGFPSSDIALITGHTVQGQAPVLDKHYIHIAQTATLQKRVDMLAKFKPLVAPIPTREI